MRGMKTLDENACSAHKGILETTKISCIPHFLREDVGDVGFAADMRNCKSTIGDPFPNKVLPIFNVTIAFGSHVMTPFDTGIVIVVQRCRRIGIADRVAKGRER